MQIEPMTIAAYDEVFALWSSMPGIGLSKADERQRIAKYLQRNPQMSFITRDAGRIVGTVLCGHDGRRGYIYHLAVHPDHRRRRIGSALLESCLNALKNQGILKCHVFVFGENADGRDFWEAKGWVYRENIGIFSKSTTACSQSD